MYDCASNARNGRNSIPRRNNEDQNQFVTCTCVCDRGGCFLQSRTGKVEVGCKNGDGVFSKGDSADEFLLTGNNGSAWEVRSSEVAIADHVGHTVTATGAVSNVTMHNMKEDTKDMAADAGMKKNNTEHGHMTITSLKHVSSTCEK